MELEVDIISKELIKPSSPTPQHPKTYKFSLLDQLIPSAYAPVILFYNTQTPNKPLDNINDIQTILKQSLSQTLTLFYPLAGKLKDDLSIDCTDDGAYYVETRVSCSMSEFLARPDLLFLRWFLPCEFFPRESLVGTHVANFQVNIFECGGISIGICILHKLLDGTALSTFLKAWSATARGDADVIIPDLSAPSSLFPADDLWLRDASLAMWGSMFKEGKSITKRFLFDASKIKALKSKSSSPRAKTPTRVEAVSAFIWKHTMLASKQKDNNNSQNGCCHTKGSIMTHLVDLRKRMSDMYMSDYSLGNILWIASASCIDGSGTELRDLVAEVRNGISKVNNGFIKEMRGDEGNEVMTKCLKDIVELGSNDGVHYIGFSSWCNLGFYEVDFGWGKPIWVTSFGSDSPVVLNLSILNDARNGNGIEAWITLDEQEMDVLINDPKVREYVVVDQSPLIVSDVVDSSHLLEYSKL